MSSGVYLGKLLPCGKYAPGAIEGDPEPHKGSSLLKRGIEDARDIFG